MTKAEIVLSVVLPDDTKDCDGCSACSLEVFSEIAECSAFRVRLHVCYVPSGRRIIPCTQCEVLREHGHYEQSNLVAKLTGQVTK